MIYISVGQDIVKKHMATIRACSAKFGYDLIECMIDSARREFGDELIGVGIPADITADISTDMMIFVKTKCSCP